MRTAATMRRPPSLAIAGAACVVLKRDIFSIVERGTYRGPDGDVDAVAAADRPGAVVDFRLCAQFPRPRGARADHRRAARHRAAALFRRQARPGAPLDRRRAAAYRAARGRPRLFPLGAAACCASCTASGFCHNDLAKEQNWLRGTDGRAYLTDFQLSAQPRRRSHFFRLAAYEDLRHFLKHKRSYVPDALTATERRILARKSLADAALDGDRQARLHLGDARPVPLHRPRRRRPAAGDGRAADRVAAEKPSAGAGRGGAGVSRPPRRDRALCLRRGQAERRRKRDPRFHGWRKSAATRHRSASSLSLPCPATPTVRCASRSCS